MLININYTLVILYIDNIIYKFNNISTVTKLHN